MSRAIHSAATIAEVSWERSPADESVAARTDALGEVSSIVQLRILVSPDHWPTELPTLLRSFPDVQDLCIRVDGRVHPDGVEALARLASGARVSRRVEVELVVPADADPAAFLGGGSTTLDQTVSASRRLRNAAIPVRWVIPAIPALVYRLEGLHVLAGDVDVETSLIAPEVPLEGGQLGENDVRFARDFVQHRPSDDALLRWPAEQRRDTLRLLDALHPTNNRLSSHPVLRFGFDATTTALHTPRIVTSMGPAPSAARASGNRAIAVDRMAHAADATGVILSGALGVLAWIWTGITTRVIGRRRKQPDAPLQRVMIIGAYGGDHIGDAAILGGVLLRINQRHGTTRAILMSQRADHTRHLVQMLELPVDVSVEEYSRSAVSAALPQVDGVVYAGGPLMDLPKQLVLHLHAVTHARGARKPFIVEGIGAGPFFRSASAWVARRLVRIADRVTVRTSADASKPLVRDLAVEVRQDPAFDYLATRAPQALKLSDRDQAGVRWLLDGADGRMLIGLNLRPIRHEFTPGKGMSERLALTRMVEERFEQRLAEALVRFHDASEKPPRIVFFPMNAIQFGMSDLRSAYRIQRLLPPRVDFRIWEDDASLDAVVSLVRRLDAVIAMRFHAAIFALSQGRPTIGIEYRIGRKDKVTGLLADADMSANCAGIETLTADWLHERLSSIAVAAAASSAQSRPPR